jgi:hypothetical protein
MGTNLINYIYNNEGDRTVDVDHHHRYHSRAFRPAGVSAHAMVLGGRGGRTTVVGSVASARARAMTACRVGGIGIISTCRKMK